MLKSIKRFISHLSLISFAVILAACGGGDTSSGGGASFAGTYSGPWNATIRGPGGSFTGTGTIVVVINPNNTVVLDPNTPVPGRGTISGNMITASYPGRFANTPGISCTGTVAVKGTVSGNTITGTIGPSTITCNGIQFTLQGRFTATKTAKAPLQKTTLGDELGAKARQAAGQ